MGWTVNLIGANVDVEAMGRRMNVDNKMAFCATEEGTREMWDGYSACVGVRMEEYAEESREFDRPDERVNARKSKASRFFKNDDQFPY